MLRKNSDYKSEHLLIFQYCAVLYVSVAQNKKGSIFADDVKENFIVPFCNFLNFVIFYG